MSKFLNPFVDFAFKYIFGREDSKPYLIDFLNALLEEEPGYSPIVDLTYRDKEAGRRNEEERNVIYDIHCKTADGRYFTVEMQNAPQSYFLERVFYYAARTVADQGKPGKDWRYQYDPVYCIALMNFELPGFKDRFRIDAGFCDLETKEPITDKIRCIMLQLPNFPKRDREEECRTELEQWMYNLIHMHDMERLAFTNSNRIFKQLEERVSYAALRGKDKDTYDADLKAYRDIMGQLEYALDKGWKKGMAEGILQGKAEGILQGKAEGILQGKAEGILQGKAEGILQGKAEGILQGKAEGILQGKAEGILQGKAEGELLMQQKMVKAMAANGLDTSTISSIAGLPVDMIEDFLKS